MLRGGQHSDWLFGNSAEDTLYGDLEADVLYGGDGNDVLVLGNDPNYGDGAIDRVVLITSDSGIDTIYGFERNDAVYILDYWPASRDESLFDATPSTPAEAEALGLAVFHFPV